MLLNSASNDLINFLVFQTRGNMTDIYIFDMSRAINFHKMSNKGRLQHFEL